MRKHFSLVATVNTDNPKAVRPVLDEMFKSGSIKEVASIEKGKGGEFQIVAELQGESAKDLNRSMLSSLRRVERKTRSRAEWTSGKTVWRFFDYVLKKTETK